MKSTKKIKLALVHDDFIQNGGAEKLFFEIIKEFKKDNNFEVKVFSSLISPSWKEKLEKEGVVFEESFLAFIPSCYRIHKFFFFFNSFYLAFQSFDFSEYNIALSSSTRFAHSIITKPTTFHISYINSPSRALWSEKKYFHGKNFFYLFIKKFLPTKRIFDFYTHNHADLLVSNSLNIKQKVLKFYRRNSIVLFPFIDLPESRTDSKLNRDDFYILISRLESWKRIDYVIKAFNLNQKNLIIIGTGSKLLYYQKISNPNIVFKGYITEIEKIKLLSKAKGLIFPQDEDFGLTILEALFYNCPIVYYKKGGAKEILNYKVGIGFETQSVDELLFAIESVESFDFNEREKDLILERYSKGKFIRQLKKIILSKSS